VPARNKNRRCAGTLNGCGGFGRPRIRLLDEIQKPADLSCLVMVRYEREELLTRHLADLHAIASELGIEGFRLLRKVELADAILNRPTPRDGADAQRERERSAGRGRGRRGGTRGRRRRFGLSR
jgi:hypothetical protein